MELYEIIARSLSIGGADIYIVPGSPLVMKCRGRHEIISEGALTAADTEILLREIYGMNENRSLDDLLYSGDDDFSFSIPNFGRFRCNAYRQNGTLAAVLRVIKFGLPDPESIAIPESIMELADLPSGLVFVTGPASSGKTTTLACMIDRINRSRQGHIVTIEDPIEYVHQYQGCIISQREVRTDTESFSGAARSAIRQGADVILLGEIPDGRTAQVAINAAEMGKLVFVEGYIYGFAKLVESLVDSIPEMHQGLFRTWLATTLRAVVVQQLIPTVDGNVVPVFETTLVTPEIRNAIREGADLSIYETGVDEVLIDLWKSGMITRENALAYTSDAAALAARMEK